VHITNPGAGTSPAWNVESAYVDVNGFDITSVSTSCITIHQEVPQFMPHDVHLIGNYCHDVELQANNCHNGGAFQTGGAQPTSPSDVAPTGNWYIGNVIRHGGNPSTSPGSGPYTNCRLVHGVYTHGGGEVFENNIISGMAGTAIAIIGMSGMTGTVVTNNTLFGNNGGVYVDECSDNGCGVADYLNISNNIIVNNGIGTVDPSIQLGGLNYRISGTHNIANNNLIYGNLPRDVAVNTYHNDPCGSSASGSTPSAGGAGCPNSNARTDSGGTAATFVNFQSDTNMGPTSKYSADNYQIKVGSNAIQNGSTNCAPSPSGISPCLPSTDFIGVARLSSGSVPDIGAYQQSGAVAGAPSAPTGLTAMVQ
jgi:hypothetical protein